MIIHNLKSFCESLVLEETMIETVKNIISNFNISGEIIEVKNIVTGHINTTFRVTINECGVRKKYTLQTINKYVFKNPAAVMENILAVTEFLKEKIKSEGGDPDRECLTVIKASGGLPYYEDEDGQFWRLYIFVDNSYTVDTVETPAQLKSAGEGFGKFQAMLSDFPMDRLIETIPAFHDTSLRFDQLMDAVKADPLGRVAGVRDEIDFFVKRHDEMCSLVKMTQDGILPLRVVHNDTKFNNILIDEGSGEALCVIDLDTVMPGLSVLDFGDAIRFAANSATEDETDLSRVYLDMTLYEAFADGFLTKIGKSLTKYEIENMPLGAKVITMELASRFLADYILGDKYFKIHREGQNLDRARCQIKLALSMEENMNKMSEIIKKYL